MQNHIATQFTQKVYRMMIFFLINFHPKGEPEACICFVIKGSQ